MKPGRLDVPGKQLNNHPEPKLLDLRCCVIKRALCAATSPMTPSGFSLALNFLVWGVTTMPSRTAGNRNSSIKLPWETVEFVGLPIEIRWPPVARGRRLCNRWTAHRPGAS
jgi:hypothetical protein